MIEKEFVIIDPHGMHARPAAALLKLARRFGSEASLGKDGKSTPLRSMLNILSLAIKHGDTITVRINGDDEAEAMKAMEEFFNEEMKKF